jgi:hypothetical protein
VPYRVAYLALAGDQDAVIVRYRLAELGYAEGKNLIFDFRCVARASGPSARAGRVIITYS